MRACGPSAGADSSRTIGVISPLSGGFYFGSIIAGVTRAAAAAGYGVVATQTYRTRLARERHHDGPLPGSPAAVDVVEGLVVVTNGLPGDRLAELAADGRPVVLVSPERDVALPTVRPDNAAGARMAVDHLLGHGHTRIGFVGDLTQGDVRERYRAVGTALAERGIEMPEEWFYEARGNSRDGGVLAARRFLAAGMPTTAVVVATDQNAIGFVSELRAQDCVLPRDQAVIGFDHTESGSRLVPRLSSVDVRQQQIGATAARLLLALLRGESVDPAVVRVPPALVLRESCGCLQAEVHEVASGKEAAAAAGETALLEVAHGAFAGPGGAAGLRWSDDAARTTWVRTVMAPMEIAAERGDAASPPALARLSDLTAALQPHPEALELSLAAIRQVEADLGGELATGSERQVALARTTTEVLLAVTRGCTRASGSRSGTLERTLAEQYQVDMDVIGATGDSLRQLTWLPGSLRGSACLGLWTRSDASTGTRELEVVGVRGRVGGLSRLVGRRLPAAQFPPPALTRAETPDATSVTFVIPVTSPERDWGLLAVTSRPETQMTYSREKHHHWATMLAVALDREKAVAELQARERALRLSASREHAVVGAIREQEERHALWVEVLQNGMWDWDVSAGTVHYSASWKQLLGFAADEIGGSPSEWLDRVHPDDRTPVSALIAAQLGGSDVPLDFEHRVRTATGEYRWLRCRAVTVLDSAGCPARIAGGFEDVTERKEHEAAISLGIERCAQTGLSTRYRFLQELGSAIVRTHDDPAADGTLVLARILGPRQTPAATDDGDEADPAKVDLYESRRESEQRGRTRASTVRVVRSCLRADDSAARIDEDTFAMLLCGVGLGGDTARLMDVIAELRSTPHAVVAVGTLESIAPYADAAEALRAGGMALLRDHAELDRRGPAGRVVRQNGRPAHHGGPPSA